MSRLALAVFVLAAVAAEAHVSMRHLDEAPWQRLAARTPEPSALEQPASFDPFTTPSKMVVQASGRESRLAWSGDNRTLEEILGSAIWRASAECATDRACGVRDANTLTPL